MANFSLNDFKSEVFRSGLARPNRFEVEILPPLGIQNNFVGLRPISNRVSLFCEMSSIPSLTVLVKPQTLYGPKIPRPFGIEYGGEALTMTFIIDQKMDVKVFFDYWIKKIVSPTTYNVSYYRDYVSNLGITQLNELDQPVYKIVLEDAFPRSLNMLELNMGAQNQVHKLNVTFAYRRYLSFQEVR